MGRWESKCNNEIKIENEPSSQVLQNANSQIPHGFFDERQLPHCTSTLVVLLNLLKVLSFYSFFPSFYFYF